MANFGNEPGNERLNNPDSSGNEKLGLPRVNGKRKSGPKRAFRFRTLNVRKKIQNTNFCTVRHLIVLNLASGLERLPGRNERKSVIHHLTFKV
jgi:hypothetical protein